MTARLIMVFLVLMALISLLVGEKMAIMLSLIAIGRKDTQKF
jgi:hypothetical protein